MTKANAQNAADDAEVEKVRQQFGEAKAAELAVEIAKLRRTPTPAGAFTGLPRVAIVLIAAWVALLETAEKLPQLLLSIPQYQANLAEFHAKLMQPDLVAAQLDKAKADAKTAAIQPDLTSVQLDKARLETKAAAFAPDTASAQLDKTKLEAKAAKWQPLATAAQGLQAEAQFVSNGNLSSTYTDSMTKRLAILKPWD